MKRLKILKYPWHTGHDYELSKLDHDFYYLASTPRQWAKSHRPLPQKIRWISSPAALAPSGADVMILHLDQWSYHEPAKRFLFLNQKRSFDGPKIVIIHGCNMVDGCSSEQMAELTQDCHVVCNSTTSLKLWNLPDSRCIVHGFSPEEWPKTDYAESKPVVVQPWRERWSATTNREQVLELEKSLPLLWVGRDISPGSFDEYISLMKKHSIFFNPSYASANPRSRAEAMLMGLAVVTTASHGESSYIENGKNGFASDNFGELHTFLKELQSSPSLQREIGSAGRQLASDVFHIDRFKIEWDTLLHEVTS